MTLCRSDAPEGFVVSGTIKPVQKRLSSMHTSHYHLLRDNILHHLLRRVVQPDIYIPKVLRFNKTLPLPCTGEFGHSLPIKKMPFSVKESKSVSTVFGNSGSIFIPFSADIIPLPETSRAYSPAADETFDAEARRSLIVVTFS